MNWISRFLQRYGWNRDYYANTFETSGESNRNSGNNAQGQVKKGEKETEGLEGWVPILLVTSPQYMYDTFVIDGTILPDNETKNVKKKKRRTRKHKH